MKYLFNDFIRRIALLYPIIKSKVPFTVRLAQHMLQFREPGIIQLLRKAREGRLAALCALRDLRNAGGPYELRILDQQIRGFFLGRFQRIINRKKPNDTIVRNNLQALFTDLHKTGSFPANSNTYS